MLDEWIPYGERQPLGGSALWDISSQYYRDKGLEAWLEIPYVITGSRVLAAVRAALGRGIPDNPGVGRSLSGERGEE